MFLFNIAKYKFIIAKSFAIKKFDLFTKNNIGLRLIEPLDFWTESDKT